jgi:micrococcal nuclease
MPIGIIRHRWAFPLLFCRVYDGDTLMDLQVDLGFNATLTITGRLYGINAPEVRGPQRERGLQSRDWLDKKIHDAKHVMIETRPITERTQGKFGRWLVKVWADGVDLNELMVSEGMARHAEY